VEKKGADDSMAGLVADGELDDGGCEMNANMSGGAQSREITTRDSESG